MTGFLPSDEEADLQPLPLSDGESEKRDEGRGHLQSSQGAGLSGSLREEIKVYCLKHRSLLCFVIAACTD